MNSLGMIGAGLRLWALRIVGWRRWIGGWLRIRLLRCCLTWNTFILVSIIYLISDNNDIDIVRENDLIKFEKLTKITFNTCKLNEQSEQEIENFQDNNSHRDIIIEMYWKTKRLERREEIMMIYSIIWFLF